MLLVSTDGKTKKKLPFCSLFAKKRKMNLLFFSEYHSCIAHIHLHSSTKSLLEEPCLFRRLRKEEKDWTRYKVGSELVAFWKEKKIAVQIYIMKILGIGWWHYSFPPPKQLSLSPSHLFRILSWTVTALFFNFCSSSSLFLLLWRFSSRLPYSPHPQYKHFLTKQVYLDITRMLRIQSCSSRHANWQTLDFSKEEGVYSLCLTFFASTYSPCTLSPHLIYTPPSFSHSIIQFSLSLTSLPSISWPSLSIHRKKCARNDHIFQQDDSKENHPWTEAICAERRWAIKVWFAASSNLILCILLF